MKKTLVFLTNALFFLLFSNYINAAVEIPSDSKLKVDEGSGGETCTEVLSFERLVDGPNHWWDVAKYRCQPSGKIKKVRQCSNGSRQEEWDPCVPGPTCADQADKGWGTKLEQCNQGCGIGSAYKVACSAPLCQANYTLFDPKLHEPVVGQNCQGVPGYTQLNSQYLAAKKEYDAITAKIVQGKATLNNLFAQGDDLETRLWELDLEIGVQATTSAKLQSLTQERDALSINIAGLEDQINQQFLINEELINDSDLKKKTADDLLKQLNNLIAICNQNNNSSKTTNAAAVYCEIGSKGEKFVCSYMNSVANNCGTVGTCYRRLRCSEIPNNGGFTQHAEGINYPLSYTEADFVFVPDPQGRYDSSGARCGRYVATAAPWWQAVNANLYATYEIKNTTSRTTFSPSCIPPQCSPYAIRTASSCNLDKNASPGLAMSNENRSSAFSQYAHNQMSNRSYTDGKQTVAYPAFSPDKTKSDFAYFKALVNYDNLSSNCSSPTEVSDGSYACKHEGDLKITNTIVADKNLTVFVSGQLIVDGNDARVLNSTDGAKYNIYIVGGDIIVKSNVGVSFDGTTASQANSCATPPSLQGIFVADGSIVVEGSPLAVGNEVLVNCPERKFVAEGIFVSWGNISLRRSFRVCGNGAGVYPNYNALNPAETFIYRPDFLVNTPAWMKQVVSNRFETQ